MDDGFRIENLTFSYKDGINTINNVFFSMNTGDIAGIVGENGSGKTTLFNCLTLGKPNSGTIFIKNKYRSLKDRWKDISYMAQSSFIPDKFQISKLLKRYIVDNEIKSILQSDSIISTVINKKFGMLSGGEKRYVEFFVTIGLGKFINILDEPFSEMAPIIVDKMINYISLLSPNKIFIISGHNFHAVNKACNKLYIMRNGDLQKFDTGETICLELSKKTH